VMRREIGSEMLSAIGHQIVVWSRHRSRGRFLKISQKYAKRSNIQNNILTPSK